MDSESAENATEEEAAVEEPPPRVSSSEGKLVNSPTSYSQQTYKYASVHHHTLWWITAYSSYSGALFPNRGNNDNIVSTKSIFKE